MRMRWLTSVTALLLVAASVKGQEGGKESAPPSIVVRVRSLDALLQDAKLLVSLTGEEAAAKSIQGLLRAKVGAKGIEGIDPARPLGAYVRFGKDIEDFSGALLVPIADEKSFLDLLTRLNLLFVKGKNDIYTVQTGKAFDLYFRFARGYAYVTGINPDNLLDVNLLDPARVLVGTDKAVVAALVRLQQIPEAAKFLAQNQLEHTLQGLPDKAGPRATPAEKEFWREVAVALARAGKSILSEGDELRLEVMLDADNKDFAMQLHLTARPGTELARTVDALGKTRSPLAAVAQKDTAFFGAADLTMPAEVTAALVKVVDESANRALSEIRDEAKRKQAEELIQALTPSLRSGRLDGLFALLGPSLGHYTVLAAAELREGDKLAKTAHDLLTQLRKEIPEAEQKKIQLDADAVGAVKIHRFELPTANAADKQIQELVGSKELYLAIRPDAVFVAIGPTALPALKEALPTVAPAASPIFVFNFDVARMVPMLAHTPAQKTLAAKVLPAGQESKLRIDVTGGRALLAELRINLSALEFLAKLKDNKRGE